MLIKNEYQIGKINEIKEELKKNLYLLWTRLEKSKENIRLTRFDDIRNKQLTDEEANARIGEIIRLMDTITAIKVKYNFDKDNYLVRPEIDNIVEKAMIETKILDDNGYVLSYAEEKKAEEAKIKEEENKKEKRNLVKRVLTGFACLALGSVISLGTARKIAIDDGRESIEKELDAVSKDLDIRHNGNGEERYIFEGKTYNTKDGVIEVLYDYYKGLGYNNEEIAIFLQEYGFSNRYVYDTLNTNKKDVNNEALARHYLEKKLK